MSLSSENTEKSDKSVNNKYAVYVSNINRRHINLEQKTSLQNPNSVDLEQQDGDQSSVCLSLLETNLEAIQETVVRCHLLKTFPVLEATGFENEGKFVVLSDETNEFGCYYHHLVKEISVEADDGITKDPDKKSSKKVSFFICLIGPGIKLMEQFCYEFGVFCYSLLPILDPECHENCKDVQDKLQNWYFHCIEYSWRCIEKFGSNLIIVFQSTLCGKVAIDCKDENVFWDLSRFADACSLNTLLQFNSSVMKSESAQSTSDSNNIINITVDGDTLSTSQNLNESSYCQLWVDKLLSCNSSDHQLIRNILENFRLKTVQDLNTLKRLLKKAENDYYSLYRAYQFLKASNYAQILLYHVREEALLSSNNAAINIIQCLKDFMNEKHSWT